MAHDKQMSPLARALEFVDSKRFDEAATFLKHEISRGSLTRSDTADLYGLLGSVLSKMGKPDEATSAYRTAVAEAIASTPGERTLQVAVARYMLSDHLLNAGDPSAAFAEADSALREEQGAHSMLYAVAAEALHVLGRDPEARAAATAALTAASSEKARKRLEDRLANLLVNHGGAG